MSRSVVPSVVHYSLPAPGNRFDPRRREGGAAGPGAPPAAAGGSVTAVQVPKPHEGAVIETVNLNKYYGPVHALRNLNLQVHEGDIFGFLGPNGAGKTTFTKCLLGFIRPTSGWVYLFGREMTHRDRVALERVGIVPDQFGFYDPLSGRQHLEFYGRLYGIPPRDLEERIEELTKLVRMEHRMEARVRTYSHGMRQRLVIAHALLNDPDLIIFDEPTTGLDPKGAHEVRLMLKDLARRGVTTFLSSHILHEVEEICTKVGILNRGVLLKLATVKELRKEFSAMSGNQVEIRIENMATKLVDKVAHLGGVRAIETHEDVLVANLDDLGMVPDVVATLVKAGGRVRGVTEKQVTLEEMFLHYTDDGQAPGATAAPQPSGVYSTGVQK